MKGQRYHLTIDAILETKSTVARPNVQVIAVEGAHGRLPSTISYYCLFRHDCVRQRIRQH